VKTRKIHGEVARATKVRERAAFDPSFVLVLDVSNSLEELHGDAASRLL
jgi:hypothetical protein